jgi:hypothetical protein
MQFNSPARLILGGEVQNMLFFCNLAIENPMPMVNTRGSAGGTATMML